MKIVFAISEVEELVKTGGLADVGKALPLALHSEGEDVAIVMPYYKSIADTFHLDTICDTQTLFTEGKVYHFDVRAVASLWMGRRAADGRRHRPLRQQYPCSARCTYRLRNAVQAHSEVRSGSSWR